MADTVETSNISRRRRNAQTLGRADYAAKRHEIVEIAAKVFKEKGFMSTTLADIGRVAGLDRATLYYYIGSKEELFRVSVEGILDNNIKEAERLLKATSLGARERLEQLVGILMNSYVENYPQMYVYIQEQMHQVAKDKSNWAKEMQRKTRHFETAVVSILTEGMAEGSLRDDINVRIAAYSLFGMFNWTHRWFNPSGKLSAAEIIDSFCKIFFDGMEQKPKRAAKAAAPKRKKAA